MLHQGLLTIPTRHTESVFQFHREAPSQVIPKPSEHTTPLARAHWVTEGQALGRLRLLPALRSQHQLLV